SLRPLQFLIARNLFAAKLAHLRDDITHKVLGFLGFTWQRRIQYSMMRRYNKQKFGRTWLWGWL
ncbi:MAG: hypothetical protein ACRECV_18605, partial [Xanthobacteraceae bacterium]